MRGRLATTIVVGVVCTLGASGCAPTQGWSRTDVRVCATDSAAVVCLQAEPDRSVVAQVGDVSIVPGECVRAPDPDAHGRLSVALSDRDGQRWIEHVRVRRSAITRLRLDADGDLAVEQHSACDAQVPGSDGASSGRP